MSGFADERWQEPVPTYGLSVTKEADREKIEVGEEVTYTITVTNTSPQDSPALTVAVTLDYEDGFAALLPLSSITATGGGEDFTHSRDAADGSLTVEGTLASGQTATFTLSVEPFDDPAALPPPGAAGLITVRVTHPTRLNTARAGSRFNHKLYHRKRIGRRH